MMETRKPKRVSEFPGGGKMREKIIEATIREFSKNGLKFTERKHCRIFKSHHRDQTKINQIHIFENILFVVICFAVYICYRLLNFLT